MALFVVCSQNPRDQCEERRRRNNTDKTADDCAFIYILANDFEINPNLDGKKTQKEIESSISFGRDLKLLMASSCIQSSIEAEKCRKIKPGFSNR